MSQERPICIIDIRHLTLNQPFSRRGRGHVINKGASANYTAHSSLQFSFVLLGYGQADRQGERVVKHKDIYLL